MRTTKAQTRRLISAYLFRCRCGKVILRIFTRNLKRLAMGKAEHWCESNMVGNNERRFSRKMARIAMCLCKYSLSCYDKRIVENHAKQKYQHPFRRLTLRRSLRGDSVGFMLQ